MTAHTIYYLHVFTCMFLHVLLIGQVSLEITDS